MPYHFADAAYDTHQFLEGPYMRVPKELGCAFTASALVSPIVSIMDKAMVQPITGLGAFFGSMGVACKEMVYTPKKFFGGLSFRLTLIVYFGTYAVANVSEAAMDYYNIREEEKRKQIKVSAASAANISLLAWRDSVFAREFSGGAAPAVPKKTPLRTISLFATRDFFTMAATFYAAPKAAKWLIKEHDVNREVAELSMALAIPVATQVLTAPLHIHAMDYYNRPVATDRMAQIQKEFSKIAFARGLRILPAFGIGSYSNNKFRELTIRQPNEDLLLTRKVTKLIQRVTRPAQTRKV
jgi:hypothetical protein